MLRFLVFSLVSATAVAAAFALSPLAGGLAVTVLLSWLLLVRFLLPRAAHRTFVRGQLSRARLYYRLLALLTLDRGARAAVRVSLAACALAGEQHDRALAILDDIDDRRLSEAARAVWLNNRAYALARQARDPDTALALIGEAIRLRPEMTGFRHTRAIALLSLGKVEEAIRDLDAVWSQSSAEGSTPLLEAERCYDLGMAWLRKGERVYAEDYFRRARTTAPDSRWAVRSAQHLAASKMTGLVLDEQL